MQPNDVGIVAKVVAEAIQKATAPLHAAIALLMGREPERGEKGDPGTPGDPGKDADPITDEKIVALLEGRPALFESAVSLYLLEHPVTDGANGQDGKDGASISLKDVQPLIEEAISKAVAAIPIPKDGANGRDGQDGKDGASISLKDVQPLIEEAISKAVAAIPIPKDGANGRDGQDGTSVTVADIQPLIAAEVSKIPIPKDGLAGNSVTVEDMRPLVQTLFDQIPAPKDGKDGVTLEDVAPLVAQKVADAIAAIPKPIDGRGISGALVDNSGHLVITMSDGDVKDIGQVVGPSGRDGLAGVPGRPGEGIDGKDGLDGLGFDDIDVHFDGEREFSLTFIRGDRRKTFGAFRLPIVIDRGVYKDGQRYERGDCVTWGGSVFIARGETSTKPETSKEWRLAVKRGRDGKDGDRGPQGPQGTKGDAGTSWRP